MKNLLKTGLLLVMMMSLCYVSYSQDAKPRKSPKATVTQRIGVDTDIVIDYSRPAVKDRKIWGELIPYGLNPGNQYSKNKDFPWRAGANENTTISFNKDLMIEGSKLPAGKYSIHMVPGEKEFKIMFNKTTDGWGSYTYDSAQDALVITVKPVATANTEWLEYGFGNLTDNSATAYLRWEKLEIPFKVQLAN
jgi:hypothetical protein